jgi:uncharacterized protein
VSGKVARLFVHPVKSLAAVEVDSAEALVEGFRHDRRWMIVDAENAFVTQRDVPAMATIRAELDGDGLVLSSAAGEVRVPSDALGEAHAVSIWDDVVLAREGAKEANDFVSAALGRPLRLVKIGDDPTRTGAAIRLVDPRYGTPNDTVGFADGFPYLVVSEASVAALESRLGSKVDVRRFRPNIVVSGCGPFEEDAYGRMTIGTTAFRLVKPCARCVMVNVDPNDGVSTPETLKALATFRVREKNVLFAMNATAVGTGMISRGDAVVFSEPKTPPC